MLYFQKYHPNGSPLLPASVFTQSVLLGRCTGKGVAPSTCGTDQGFPKQKKVVTLYSLFHNVAKIFHNVENLFITSISARSSSPDVVNDVRTTTAVGRHSVQHRYIVTTNMRRTETNVNRTTHDGSDMTFGWSAMKRNIYTCGNGDQGRSVFE